MRAFQAEHPGSTIEVRDLQQDEIQAGLIDGTLDVGLVNLFECDDLSPELESTTLLTGRPVAVIPATHALASSTEVTASDLRGESFIAMRAGYLMYRFAHRVFGPDLPREWHSTDGAEMGKMMVAEGLGVSLLPDYSVIGDPLERAGLIVARPIAGDSTTVSVVSVHRRHNRVPAPVRDLLGHLLARAEQAQSSRLPARQDTA